jgi:hypothetical protein
MMRALADGGSETAAHVLDYDRRRLLGIAWYEGR